jgi:hypothetical protein
MRRQLDLRRARTRLGCNVRQVDGHVGVDVSEREVEALQAPAEGLGNIADRGAPAAPNFTADPVTPWGDYEASNRYLGIEISFSCARLATSISPTGSSQLRETPGARLSES